MKKLHFSHCFFHLHRLQTRLTVKLSLSGSKQRLKIMMQVLEITKTPTQI